MHTVADRLHSLNISFKMSSLSILNLIRTYTRRSFLRCSLHHYNSKFRTKSTNVLKEFLRIPENRLQKESVMSKTKVISSVEECLGIVSKISSMGEPIGVDCEGVHLETVALIQIRTYDDQIYLIRTGMNPKLLWDGGIKRLLESPDIIKIMHASAGDCLSIYKAGIRMWGLYDTAVAHKIISYQTLGTSINSSTIGFNSICEHYGVFVNPLKEAMHGTLWTRDNSFTCQKDIPNDLVFYAACDVEPLLDLYNITQSIIEPDFVPMCQELMDNEILRAIDPKLVRMKQQTRQKVEQCNVFLNHLSTSVSKCHLHHILARHNGYKKILFSECHHTAHVIMSTRQEAVLVQSMLQENEILTGKFGPSATSKLIIPLEDEEMSAVVSEHQKVLDRLQDQNFLTDPVCLSTIVDILLKVDFCPIAIDFSLESGGGQVVMEMFVGAYPIVRFPMNRETIVEGGIGRLFSAQSVTKIMGRVDAANVYAALRMCSLHSIRFVNVFEVNSAFKFLDYLEYGQSTYKSTSTNLRNICRLLGLTHEIGTSKLELLLNVYHILRTSIPSSILSLLADKIRIDLEIGYGGVFEAPAKEARKVFRQRIDTNAVHIYIEPKKKKNIHLRSVLQNWFHDKKLSYLDLICEGPNALLFMEHHPDTKIIIDGLNGVEIDRECILVVNKVEFRTFDRAKVKPITLQTLDQYNLPHINSLKKFGFFEHIKNPLI